jgi:hypothetical protein
LKFLYKYNKRRTTARTIKTTTTVTAAAGVIIKLKGVYFL